MPKVLLQAWKKFFAIQHAQPEDTNELFQKLFEDLQIINEELAEYINSPSWNRPTFYGNDEEHSIQYKEYLENSSNAIAPVLPTEEPEYSLSMGYEHPSTTSETESDEVIESSVKNLVQIPSEYEVNFDNKSECDVPVKNESSPVFTTFANPLFDCNDDFTSSDDELLSNKDVPMENFKDTARVEFGQNRKSQYFCPLVDTGKSHETPRSYHNKDNSANHVDNNYHYSSDCSSVPAHRQTGIMVDNHNHNVNHSRITCTSKSRTEFVEDD
nr:hypothetical protein [Tanacetum cinerariifolium]